MAEANPKAGADAPATDEQSAIARVAGLLEPEGPPRQDDDEQPEANREEPEAAAEEAEASSEEKAEPEPTDDEGDELPDTLEGFAEALGISADDLAGHLKVPKKVDGKVEYVTVAEAISGHQRDADYRQKTMELAEQRRQMEAQNQQALERWQQEFQRLDLVIQSLEGEAEGETSPEKLAQILEDDPQEYLRVMAHQQARQAKIVKAKTARDEALQKQQAEQQQVMASYRAEQQRLLVEAMPEISDTKKLSEFEGEADSFLKTMGYSNEDIGMFFGGAFDHRHVLILRDAMRYRAMQQGKKTLPKRLEGLAKVQKPGAASSRKTDADKLTASRERLRQLGKKGKSARMQQEDAAVRLVKGML
jgi:hypothetical protein